MPPQYARTDPDAVGSGAADPMSLPGAGNYNPFLVFTPRFAATQAAYSAEMNNHPSTFNPFHWPRGYNPMAASIHTQGMDDLVKLGARYSDQKKRWGETEYGKVFGKSFGDPSLAVGDTVAPSKTGR